MRLVTVRVEHPRFRVLFLSDMHFGHRNCDEKAIEKYLRIAQEEDVRVIIGGDLFEAKLRKSKGRLSEQVYTPGEQLAFWKKALKPLAGKIDAIVSGNHEERIAEEAEIEVLKEVADYICAEYDPVGAWVVYMYNRGKASRHIESVSIYATHGASGAILPGGKLTAAYRLRWNVSADVILTGHVHQFTATTGEFVDAVITGANKVLKRKPQWVITNGACLRTEGSYGERKGYSFQPIVQTCLEVNLAGDEPIVRPFAI